MRETRGSLIARVLVGGLLVLESIALLIVGAVVAIIGGLSTLLSFGVSGGSASDANIAAGFAIIGVTIATPFVLAVAVAVAGLFLLLRRRRHVVVSASVCALLAQLAVHWFIGEGFHPAELVPFALHLLAIAVAFVAVPNAVGP